MKEYTLKEIEAKFNVPYRTLTEWIRHTPPKLKAKLKLTKYPSGIKCLAWKVREEDWYDVPTWMRVRNTT